MAQILPSAGRPLSKAGQLALMLRGSTCYRPAQGSILSGIWNYQKNLGEEKGPMIKKKM